jgi:pimeloyl-ACP methyl ester carboxylesterase/membrane protein DedA with SNARE-associated domain
MAVALESSSVRKKIQPDEGVKVKPPRKRRWLRWAVSMMAVGYSLALAGSVYQRWHTRGLPTSVSKDKRLLPVSAVVGERTVPEEVTMAFRDFPAQGGSDRIPVVLIHGSPGSSNDLRLLAEQIKGPRRVIAPDLPGFGESSRQVPDYSFRAHAVYVWQLMDRLGIRRVHLVGFSMGGGVVLHMARLAPNRVASLTMLSAIGVQEMELLGDYHLNHAVHGIQLAGLWLVKIALPRFGEFNHSDMGLPYAHNFYDSDQRPLRSILQSYDGPMLILHGLHDPLVPIEAAVETKRLVPQSEIQILPGDHFMVFVDPRPLVPLLDDFLDRVEAGRVSTRTTAPPDRIALANQPMDTSHFPKPGYVTALVMLISLVAATFVSEDLACISAGLLVAEGHMSFLFATFACFIGIFIGDMLLFVAGRYIGRPAIKRAPLRWLVGSGSLEGASKWLGSNGAMAIVTARFVPGTRLPTYLAAGALRTSAKQFFVYFLIAAALWTPLVVGLSTGLAMPLMHSGFMPHRLLSGKLLLVLAGIFLLVRLLTKLATYRGRRELVRRWRRVFRWEFWPPYLFYPPVIAYILYIGVKFRSWTLFTAANPGIPAGGFVGESKHQILEQMKNAGPWLPASTLLPSGEPARRLALAEDFMSEHKLAFPVVLKPDAGQRGSGVVIARSSEQLHEYLAQVSFPTILQEYVSGEEFGVFYYRYPGNDRGQVFSVTEKRMPVLFGDGKHTLEELVLADDRAACMSDFYLRKNSKRRQQVPAAGERVQLVEIGTHCRGAIFLDGGDTITPCLEDAIDGIAKGFDGFFFGRFDIRVPSRQDFVAGRNMKIIELNGVTSEATHIYDPKLGLFAAYRVLFKQWRLAFEIGDLNRVRGVCPTPALELLRRIREYRHLAQGHPE